MQTAFWRPTTASGYALPTPPLACTEPRVLDMRRRFVYQYRLNRIERTDGTRRGMVGATRAFLAEHTIMAQQPRPGRCPWVDLAKADYIAYHDQE